MGPLCSPGRLALQARERFPCAARVWLYVDDQLQQMRPHRGAPPRQHPSPPEEPPQLLLGGLSEAAASFRNFSGCISNVFVQR